MSDLNDRLDLLDRILSRNIQWIGSADSKAVFLFAVDSAMLGVLATLIPSMRAWTIASGIVTSIASLLLLSSVICVVFVNFPRLHGPRNSLVYFGGISAYDESKYVEKVLQGVSEELLQDFARQCHRNAEISQVKYKFIKNATIFAFVAFPFWIVAISLLYQLKLPLIEP